MWTRDSGHFFCFWVGEQILHHVEFSRGGKTTIFWWIQTCSRWANAFVRKQEFVFVYLQHLWSLRKLRNFQASVCEFSTRKLFFRSRCERKLFVGFWTRNDEKFRLFLTLFSSKSSDPSNCFHLARSADHFWEHRDGDRSVFFVSIERNFQSLKPKS